MAEMSATKRAFSRVAQKLRSKDDGPQVATWTLREIIYYKASAEERKSSIYRRAFGWGMRRTGSANEEPFRQPQNWQ